VVDRARIVRLGVEVVEYPLADENGDFARHDTEKLADAILELYQERAKTRVF